MAISIIVFFYTYHTFCLVNALDDRRGSIVTSEPEVWEPRLHERVCFPPNWEGGEGEDGNFAYRYRVELGLARDYLTLFPVLFTSSLLACRSPPLHFLISLSFHGKVCSLFLLLGKILMLVSL